MKRSFLLLGAVTCCWLTAGCGGPPQVSPTNRRLVESLRTATSARQLEWVEESAAQIETAKIQGGISQTEYDTFQAIIELARAGKWKEAQAEAMRLSKAQKATAEEVERLKAKRKL